MPDRDPFPPMTLTTIGQEEADALDLLEAAAAAYLSAVREASDARRDRGRLLSAWATQDGLVVDRDVLTTLQCARFRCVRADEEETLARETREAALESWLFLRRGRL